MIGFLDRFTAAILLLFFFPVFAYAGDTLGMVVVGVVGLYFAYWGGQPEPNDDPDKEGE